MLNLKVNIDINSGFCFGVVYAIQLAEEILDEKGILYCLGDIVHNDEEINRLRKKGLITISHDQLKEVKNETVLLRAHGEPPSTYQIAIENNLTLVDASCPVVLKLQNRVKQSADEDKQIYIYGKRGHAEVEGLIGQSTNEVVVFKDLSELDFEKMPKKISLYSQTTKSTENFYKIYNQILAKGIEVDLNDTTCRQVSNRDIQIRTFAQSSDVIVFVSGLKSSNGKVLFDVCKQYNPRTYFVSSTSEIDQTWFNANETVGICGATSTPMWLMKEAESKLVSF
ncbi:MAG: 4-hydroxy-3-methylbut-2-enyl diphosphate reductase [Bacteroidetes bacterium]|nr:4-hydroxy-3-methylbut-2-enyl diphosphate reductase [Bacteroidota bacterium]MBK7431878.1 4-hydroxy-3-methylbut-2-enyl diphosphate reductase [Bacteroidota bacterium]MBK7570710.1 4-hydroxy-3-methylbut-2-enyl diphosphate reductase [Bacteroidota bacterium]MBK8587274.1 4-hydroxy-3-methylbut-2-enyl diphosphate reductase [Bacteroidota bacterium]MBP9789632.1 4-hydroxy-3-methylbut-2-enyl diphosphate reductase [Bacteroidia bacterium]